MEAWKGIGGFIGSHMAFISPTCVVLAVLFPDQLSLMKPAVPFLFAFMTFQGALSNTFQNLRQALRHPAPLLAILGVSAVLMPVLACALAQALFGFDQARSFRFLGIGAARLLGSGGPALSRDAHKASSSCKNLEIPVPPRPASAKLRL